MTKEYIEVSELRGWIDGWFEMNEQYHPHSKRTTIPTCELLDIIERIPKIESKEVSTEEENKILDDGIEVLKAEIKDKSSRAVFYESKGIKFASDIFSKEAEYAQQILNWLTELKERRQSDSLQK